MNDELNDCIHNLVEVRQKLQRILNYELSVGSNSQLHVVQREINHALFIVRAIIKERKGETK